MADILAQCKLNVSKGGVAIANDTTYTGTMTNDDLTSWTQHAAYTAVGAAATAINIGLVGTSSQSIGHIQIENIDTDTTTVGKYLELSKSSTFAATYTFAKLKPGQACQFPVNDTVANVIIYARNNTNDSTTIAHFISAHDA
jgi:hypothetical protein